MNTGQLSDTKQDDLAPVQAPRTKTFGENLVGISFNPSGNPAVNRAKELCAELADLVNDHWQQEMAYYPENSLKGHVYAHAIGEILNAQMNVVKVLTLKY